MTETKIIAVSIVAGQAPWTNGDRLLAFFDIEIRGFRLYDCLLIRTAHDRLLAQTPRGDNKRANGRAIQIGEPALREEMANAAHKAFVALGGVEVAA